MAGPDWRASLAICLRISEAMAAALGAEGPDTTVGPLGISFKRAKMRNWQMSIRASNALQIAATYFIGAAEWPNAKGERPPPREMVDRARCAPTGHQPRAEKLGGGSAPPAGSTFYSWFRAVGPGRQLIRTPYRVRSCRRKQSIIRSASFNRPPRDPSRPSSEPGGFAAPPCVLCALWWP